MYILIRSLICPWLCDFGSLAKLLCLVARNCEGQTEVSLCRGPCREISRKEVFYSPELGLHRHCVLTVTVSDALHVSPSDGIKGVPQACQASPPFSLVVIRSCVRPWLSKLLIAWLCVQVPQEHRLLHTQVLAHLCVMEATSKLRGLVCLETTFYCLVICSSLGTFLIVERIKPQ